MAPLSLYVHTPWCREKCPYCDFNSHKAPATVPQHEYVRALLQDLRCDLSLSAELATRPVSTVFIGGGTPSLLSAAALNELLAGLRDIANLSDDCEITAEANPESADFDKLKALMDAGVNRLSLGAQSFDDALLSAIGRVHDARATLRAYANARRAGFVNINIDLMFALPGQSLTQCESDMRQLIALAPEHVSLYQLTLEPNTLFHARPPSLPAEEDAAHMERVARDMLAAHGWERYEVSAHARAGHACAHNMNYWRFGDYLAIGAGAHGKLTLDGRCLRLVKRRDPKQYMRQYMRGVNDGFVSERREVAGEELIFEFMLNATRLVKGFTHDLFTATTRLPFAAIAAPLARLQARGLMTVTATRARPTALGLRFLNDIQSEFLPDNAAAPDNSRTRAATATHRLAFFDDGIDGLSLLG